MPSLTKKILKGRPYYYARECKRVKGKPRIVWQKYLGRVEDIIKRMTEDPATTLQPEEAIVSEFGAVVALYDLARQLDLVEHVDHHVPKKGPGPSVGTYLLVAVLNRCVAPCSKASIGDWFRETALRRIVDIEPRQLSSQRYWDNLDRVSHEDIVAIERDITTRLVRQFDLDLRRVLFDATNFFTFIDTFNGRSTLARRGKNKEGRASLRIVGLALLVTADFHVPLLHRTYPGNQTDAPTFASLTSELVARYRKLTDGTEHVTIIFDKGNNSQDNLQAVEDSPYHFIGSLVPTQHAELLQIPEENFRSLADDGLPGVTAYRTTKKVFGIQRTVVVTFNDKLFVSQARTLLREIAKRQQGLADLQDKLRRRRSGEIRGGKPTTMVTTTKEVHELLKARHMKDLFHVDIREEEDLPTLSYNFDTDAWERLQRTLLGKTILFTDNDDWTDAEIVRGYRAQHHIEDAFRCMKDPHCISLRPQYCWTDQKVEVHVFTCVLALMLCSLLQREIHRLGIDRSLRSLLDDLGKIREVAVVYPPARKGRKPTLKTTMSRMSREQRALFDVLDLGRYRST